MEVDRKNILSIVLVIAAIAIVAVIFIVTLGFLDSTRWNVVIDEKSTAPLTSWLGVGVGLVTLIVSIVAVVVVYFRLQHQDDVVETDNRFNVANALLGNKQTSARTGAIHSLYYLAVDSEKYRRPIADILCGYIRAKTQDSEYQAAHSARPSDDVQTAISLLFGGVNEAPGLYTAFSHELPRADLTGAYLVGANFVKADCRTANFWKAQCQGAQFSYAHCEGANFTNAHLQGTSFWGAQCQGASFMNAHCQVTYFKHAECQGALFKHARCHGIIFEDTQCQGAYTLTDQLYIPLLHRVGQYTEMEAIILAGEITGEEEAAIENAIGAIPESLYAYMRHLVGRDRGRDIAYGCPVGTVPGELVMSPKLESIIEDLRKREIGRQRTHRP